MRAGRAGLALASVLTAVLAISGCDDGGDDAWPATGPEELVVATGCATGIYQGYGVELGEVLEESYDIAVSVTTTGGSVENLQRLGSGRAHVAFSAADAVQDAVTGDGGFAEPLEIRALARVYDDFVHLVVREESHIRTIDDLRSRTVSLGATRSGTSLIANRVLAAAGVDTTELKVRSLGIDASITALRAGEIDAFFWSGGLRTPGITALSEQLDIRLVPLGDLVEDVRARQGSAYRPGVVPEGMYGSAAEVPTLAVPNYLMVRADMPAPVARALVSTLFDARSRIAAQVPAAGNLDLVRAIYTQPAGLHPGALRYYRETKS
jgi:TRAP transporter TAXI family solute receptor